MSSTDRQNKMIAAEDWKRIYQSFKNADFQSYDFDNLRRTMVAYLRENYPEDFNDYIESSEYLALIDLIAFLGQNLAFRFDLNARDNFLELAERRESVLRLARLLSYNPKRCQAASGLLKFTSVSTSESIFDSNGRDLANKTILWNDTANPNWYEQFVKVVNAALVQTSQFGKPIDKADIAGVPTEQYRFNATNTEVPLYSFSKGIDGRNMPFEIVSSGIRNGNEIYEESPFPGRSPAFLYRDDGGGAASSNTGFFMHFRQGALQESTFSIQRPSTSEIVDVDTTNINNSDVWLYKLDSLGIEETLWTKVDAVEGNNIIYNSISKNVRSVYSVLTKSNDRVRLVFSDGVFGDLPEGTFKVYYRVSNGLSYTINPSNIKNVSIDIPYVSRAGKQETLTIALGLFYTVNNSSASETSASIKQNAPATYYTQNRMITGEDYNIYPLSSSQSVVKIRALNRVSSGISRYFDLKDASGKYSHTNMFGNDGRIIREEIIESFSFSYSNQSDIENIVLNQIESRLNDRSIIDFYLTKFPYQAIAPNTVAWYQHTVENNKCTGYLYQINPDDSGDYDRASGVGPFVTTQLKYFVPDAMVKFLPPAGKLFSKIGKLIPATNAPVTARSYIWTKVVAVTGNGTTADNLVLDTGMGPVTFNDIVPTGSIISTIIPKYVSGLEDSVRARVIDSIYSNRNFALRYSVADLGWRVISEANINTKENFDLGRTGDKTNQQLDSSWVMLFETDGELYTASVRGVRYVFESDQEIRFFYDNTDKVYDTVTGKTIKDKITVLGINTKPGQTAALGEDYDWEIVGEYTDAGGYTNTTRVLVSFYDSDDDSIVDDPERFELITKPAISNYDLKIPYIYIKRNYDSITGEISYSYLEDSESILAISKLENATAELDFNTLESTQLIHIVDTNRMGYFDPGFVETTEYRAVQGRDRLKFQYIHAANESSRIDPAATNIIDVFMLTRSYDTEYRKWLKGSLDTMPKPPTSDELYISFGQQMNQVKAISDEIIYHPVRYKNLFGSSATSNLQAVFKVVKNKEMVISDSDIKVGVVEAINEFFDIERWDFGDVFHFGELATYIMNKMENKIANIVIVPRQPTLLFGNLYEIKSSVDEIFISSATVDDVEIITEVTESKIRASSNLLTL